MRDVFDFRASPLAAQRGEGAAGGCGLSSTGNFVLECGFSGISNGSDFFAPPNAGECGPSSTANVALDCPRQVAGFLDVASSALAGEPACVSGDQLPLSLGCSGPLQAQGGSLIRPLRPRDISFSVCQQNSCISKSLLSHGQRDEPKCSLGNIPSDGEGPFKRDEPFLCVSDPYEYVGKSPELLESQEIQREGEGLHDFKTPQSSKYDISASGDFASAQFAETPRGSAPELGEQLSRDPAGLSGSESGVGVTPMDSSPHGRGNKSGALCFVSSCGSGDGN